MLPYLKWLKERAHDPKGTPKKLKIFYIDLGVRSEELPIVRWMAKYPRMLGKLSLAGHLGDLVLDGYIDRTLMMLRETPNVQLIGLRLQLGTLAVIDSSQIPTLIQRSRECVLDQLRKADRDLAADPSMSLVRNYLPMQKPIPT